MNSGQQRLRTDPEDDIRSGVPPATTTFSATPPRRRTIKKQHLIILIMVAFALLVGSLVYALWYQRSEKVLADALLHALTAKTVTYDGTAAFGGAEKTDVSFNGESAASGSSMTAKVVFNTAQKAYVLEGQGMLTRDGDLYVNLTNMKDLAANYRVAIPEQSQPLFDGVIEKVDNKWIKVKAENLKNYNADLSSSQRCLSDAIGTLQNDGAQRSKLLDLYGRHPFVQVDTVLESKDGSFGYRLKPQPVHAAAFIDEFKKLPVYGALRECDASLAESMTQIVTTDADMVSVDVWVSQWSHRLTKLVWRNQADASAAEVTVSPTFGQSVSMTLPKKFTTLEQLQKDVQQVIRSSVAQ